MESVTNPSKCPTCGGQRIRNRRSTCTDPWHEQVSTGAETRPEQSLPDGRRPECLPAEMPTAPTPIPGEVPTDLLDALIEKWPHSQVKMSGTGTFKPYYVHSTTCKRCAVESARAAHDALVSRRAREEALGFLGALVDKWRDRAKILRHSDPLTANRGDGVSWCAGDLQAALANPESGNWLEQRDIQMHAEGEKHVWENVVATLKLNIARYGYDLDIWLAEHDAALISATLGAAAERFKCESCEGIGTLTVDCIKCGGEDVYCQHEHPTMECPACDGTKYDLRVKGLLAITPDAVAAWQAEKGKQSQ